MNESYNTRYGDQSWTGMGGKVVVPMKSSAENFAQWRHVMSVLPFTFVRN